MSYSEEALVKKFLPDEKTEHLHDALQDIIVLKKLVETLNISEEYLKNECKSIEQIESNKTEAAKLKRNKASLQCLEKIVPTRIIYLMTKEGITKLVLMEAYKNNPTEGIKILLSTSVNNKARTNTSSKHVKAIAEKIKSC